MPKDIVDNSAKTLHEDLFNQPVKFQPDHIDVDLHIHDIDDLDVTASFHYKDKFPTEPAPAFIELDFEDIKLSADERAKGTGSKSLLSIEIDGTPLQAGTDYEYLSDSHKIKLKTPQGKNSFTLKTKTNIDPEHNTTGVGLYMSDGNIFFKGETMNFRKIAPVQDRTDVLSTFTVTIAQNPDAENLKGYNQLLSNGNKVAEGTDKNGYNFATYQDNEPKPCYLMGVQAGNFVTEEYGYTFSNGHTVKIFTHLPEVDRGKDQYVVDGIKLGMEYFDKEFGLIYDKPEYHLTSLTSFNAGATETKGMAMFSAGYFTTDKDFVPNASIFNTMSVVIHEYIHEFIGNTFYIKNWLELGCKEGQTVFMEQIASAAMLADPDVVRMNDMNGVVNGQFPFEDVQQLPPIPTALNSERDHYTSTTYSKGAECFRMIHTLMGHDAYTKLVKEYVGNHHNQNAGIDDFLALAETHYNYDFSDKFSRWFKQAGRATVTSTGQYKADSNEYVIALDQSFKEADKLPLPIPLNIALCIDGQMDHEQIFLLDQENDVLIIPNVTEEPAAYSINRGFSAPVEINHDRSNTQMLALLQAESDGVTQGQIIQDIHKKEILGRYAALKDGQTAPIIAPELITALKTLIERDDIAPDVLAKLLVPGTCGGLRSQIKEPNPVHLSAARDGYLNELAGALHSEMDTKYTALRSALSGPYSDDKPSKQKRALATTLLSFTTRIGTEAEFDKIKDLYAGANNGHDRLCALGLLSRLEAKHPKDAQRIEDDCVAFLSQDTNGIRKAIETLAAKSTDDPKALLQELTTNPKYGYDWGIPHHGKMISAFFTSNYKSFHNPNGEGYEAIADLAIIAGGLNPEVAASIGGTLCTLNSFDSETAKKMYTALERVHNTPNMPKQLREAVKDAVNAYAKKNSAQSGNNVPPSCSP
tara:strand:- start:300581 stop:303352 length:2772 start_codon:yes stop_codon:yes gene_type:complete